MDTSGRLHSFDNLRAVMMWLGIVLHVAVNHTAAPTQLPWRDTQTSQVADLIMIFIHAFRMPVFFILAGYFVALLVVKRGYKGMLKHRMRRLALPFAIFWPLLLVCTTLLILVYLHLMAYGTVGIDLSILQRRPATSSPLTTMHMWFIYYLIWFCVFAALLAPVMARLPARLHRAVDAVFGALAANWWGPLVLAVPLAIVGSSYRGGVLVGNGSFILNLNEVIHNGLFFGFGLLLYRHQDSLFSLYTKHWVRNTVAGFVAFALSAVAFQKFKADPQGIPHIAFWVAFLYNLTSWLWSLALIGLFLRYLPTQNRVLRYVSESSYWVFLMHMLGTIGFGAVLYGMPFGALTKMSLNILATTVACLVSYHLFVRDTRVGVLLNGRRLPKTAAMRSTAAAEPT